MKHIYLSIGLGVIIAATAAAQSPTGTTGTAAMAAAFLKDASGRAVGQARLQQTPHGVLLRLELKNATPGIHALHLHDVGACDAPSFESAGGHFAPDGREHGFLDPKGPHAGDLPNIHVPSTTELEVEYLIGNVTLDAGPRSLFDADGSAIVIHAGPDDYASEPAGDAGHRLVCGVIGR
jgi:Cu-Zn family superoxide dismutase